MSDRDRIRELIDTLNRASDAYYNSQPIMSDAKWDNMFDELNILERQTGIIMSNSPTQNVGYEVKSSLEKVKHTSPMMSLDKTKAIDDLQKFTGNHHAILSLKMDGLSLRLTYHDGDLVRAETRGNGEIGENVYHNAKVMKNIPLHIDIDGTYEIDGECIITYGDFEKIKGDYKNPRNLASGSIRQLDSKIAAKRNLRFIAWKVVGGDHSNYYDKRLDYAKRLGFDVVPYLFFNSSSEIRQEDIYHMKAMAEDLGYPIDGLVLDHNDINYGKTLGMTGHHIKSAIAFKFGEDEETTTLQDIEWSVGKTGEITPVAIFNPVELAGTEVSRASLHNVSVMEALYPGIWHKNMELVIKKANDIIPFVNSADPAKCDIKEELSCPKFCPVCGGTTEVRTENGSTRLYCTNPYCKGKLLGLFKTFAARDYMNIDGLSEKTLELLINKGLIEKFSDIYRLKHHRRELLQLPKFGAKKVNNILMAIDNSREVTLDRFIASLGIPLIGRTAGKIIARNFTPDEFFDIWKSGYTWSNIEGIGPQMEESMNTYANKNWDDIMELLSEIQIKVQGHDAPISDVSLLGKTFVVTGKLEHFSNRKELTQLINDLGGVVSSAVSKNTDVLINNDIASNSSKNKKAKELGIPIWSEKDFLKFIKREN